jgi:type I restriction enzyme, R subunit
MSQSITYQELISSQIPALQLLINMGWTYLSPEEALALRGGKERQVVLSGILEAWLRENNRVQYKGQSYAFSDGNIQQAIKALLDEPFESLLLTNEKLYDLLALGISLPQTIEGDKKSYSLSYINWKQPEKNVYHVSEEFAVSRRGSQSSRRPDIVLFVNGIPLVVIECKRPDLQTASGEKAIAQAISQLIGYQKEDEIPHLFVYAQLLMAVAGNDTLYASAGTAAKFWALWQEEDAIEETVSNCINRPLSKENEAKLYDWRPYHWQIRRHFAELGERLPTAQDRSIYALLRPERLLELSYQYLVFDGGVKKIARYQQYFAIKASLRRVSELNVQGQRTGGVIWHTTGSGKSLTMVMLAKAISLSPTIRNPRIILVTDRVDLDEQIYKTFAACGKQVVQANDGGHLVRLVSGKLRQGEKSAEIITTVINKFETAAAEKIEDKSENIFVLVDESHRSQYGAIHAKMKQVFPRACYIGFTGTPLTQSEKSTARKFGDFIHKYTMRQAVEDKAVVPLLYEGRIVEQDVDKEQLQRWFERRTQGLNEEQLRDLKLKMSRSEVINQVEQRIREIAYDIAVHYKLNWRGTGFKAQLATSSKLVAVKFLAYLLEEGLDAALAISPPDSREGHEDVHEATAPEVQNYWKRMMAQYGNEERMNREILRQFHEPDGIEILIVVDKLLTGFDEPRNTVLYIDKNLKEHGLLQAIARVNRLFEGKDFGYIIDYRGVLGELNEAMDTYGALEEYDREDINGTFTDVSAEIKRLPQIHSDLWAIFRTVTNQDDREALERFLEAEDKRQHFYETLTDFARALKVALSTVEFYEDVSEKTINGYKADLKFFHNLRQSVKLRYAEAVDYREYEDKIRELLDKHITATGTIAITELVNIFDAEAFNAEVERLHSPKAKADTILNRMKRTITENMDEDPAFYRRFSELVEEAIQAYKEGRLSEAELLQNAFSLLSDLREGKVNEQPEILSKYLHAGAFYGLLKDRLSSQLPENTLAEMAIGIEECLEAQKVRDWLHNRDVQKRMMGALDELFYEAEQAFGLSLSNDDLNAILKEILNVAIARDSLGS